MIDDRAVCLAFHGQDDDGRPILLTLFPTGSVLVMPEIGIGDDEARLRVGDRHAAQTDRGSRPREGYRGAHAAGVLLC
jgi:hypothetical protein